MGWRLAVVAVTTALVLAAPTAAFAVKSTGATRVTPAPSAAGVYATYSVGAFTVGNNQTVTRMRVTFPAQCNVSAAQPVAPGDTLIIAGQTVTIIFGTPKLRNTSFTGSIANIRNPVAAGTFAINQQIVFTLSTGATENHTLRKNTFTINSSPYLILTITTPDPDPALLDVDFGAVDPGGTLTADVEVEVDSSLPYTLTRSYTPGGPLGLMIGGFASPFTATVAGYRLFPEVYSITPPWTTDPGTYSAAVVYTVTH